MGWFSFGGGTGGLTADQRVSDMRMFASLPRTTHVAEGNLAFNGTAQVMPDGSFRLTPALNNSRGSIVLRNKLDLSRQWQVSFRYDIAETQIGCADGFSVFLHSDPNGTAALGGGGGGRGHSGLAPMSGITVNIHGENYFAWVENGQESGRANNPNGITPRNGNLYVTMQYDGVGLLRVWLRQGDNVYTTTRAVALADVLSAPDAWLAISGATGGENADQRISELTITHWLADYRYPSYGTSVNVMAGSVNSTLYGSYLPPEANADTLTLWDGAALDIRVNEMLAANTAYSVAFQNVVLHGVSSVATHGNGVLSFANLYVEAGSSVKITGNVSFPDNTLTVHAPVDMPRGFYMIADFTDVVGVDGNTTFALDPVNSPPRSKLIFRDGKLYLSLVQGTVMILR
jgi:hypothetical protein